MAAFVGSLHNPPLFIAAVLGHVAVVVAGFAPSVLVFFREGLWWGNPVTRPAAWAIGNTRTMKLHSAITAAWVAVSVVQYALLPLLMFRRGTRGV